jgi:hypothetical protein
VGDPRGRSRTQQIKSAHWRRLICRTLRPIAKFRPGVISAEPNALDEIGLDLQIADEDDRVYGGYLETESTIDCAWEIKFEHSTCKLGAGWMLSHPSSMAVAGYKEEEQPPEPSSSARLRVLSIHIPP